MTSLVSVADQLFERMYVKTVLTPDEQVSRVPPGEVPGPTDQVLTREGEPAFRVSLNDPVRSDDDVPNEVGYALRRAAQRFFALGRDGTPSTDGMTIVEWIIGPAVLDGTLVMYLDTDGSGAGQALIGSMTSILVEELETAGLPVAVSVPSTPMSLLEAWASAEERGSGE